jgi:signal transduction histidine kinase
MSSRHLALAADQVTPEDLAQAAEPTAAYGVTLEEYLRTHNEAALFRASLLSQSLVQSGLGPDEIVALHFESLEKVLADRTPRERVHAVGDAYQFLLEVMIAYGVQYKQYLELRLTELNREAAAREALERQRLEEAEQAAQEKDDLLRVVAHELRTPLTAAKGNVDMVVRSLTQGRGVPLERLTPLLAQAQEALDRLSRLTGNLVEASRGELPQLNRAPQDLVALVAQACRWARPAAVSKGISLEWERQPRRVFVSGDADALLSVLGNLLSNAVRYTPVGGQIVVRHGLARGAGGRWAWVEVRDTGIGMSPEEQARIFEKFYRAPGARRLGAQGLGLGLALVRQYAEAHDGRVEVESAPQQGSTFRVLLPAAAAHGARATAVAAAASAGALDAGLGAGPAGARPGGAARGRGAAGMAAGGG